MRSNIRENSILSTVKANHGSITAIKSAILPVLGAASLTFGAAQAQTEAPTQASLTEIDSIENLGAAPAAEPLTGIAQFSAFNADSQSTINYEQVNVYIEAVSVQSRGRVKFRYDAIGGQAKPFLDGVINFLEAQDPTQFNRDEQLAYWLNFRNLLVLQSIADTSRRRSLATKRGTLGEPGSMWTEKRTSVNGERLSIDDIERGIILANWEDPNILYGLYQGVRGGPAYPATSFSGATVTQELVSAARASVNARNTVKVRKNSASLPAYYEWFQAGLFGGSQETLLAHLNSYANEKLGAKLANATEVSFRSMSFGVDEEVARVSAPIGGGGLGGGGGGTAGS